MFPGRAVLAAEGSVFPSELVQAPPATLFVDVGQRQLATAREQQTLNVSDSTLLVLAFAAKGVRTHGAVSFATGLDDEACGLLFQQCIDWGFLTPNRRITSAGSAELDAARRMGRVKKDIAPRGEDNYYPKMLRKST
jgi:hypothetical protein